MTDTLDARTRADAQAARLAPAGVAAVFLGEAIWHRTLAAGTPTDREVLDYLARCDALRLPISGRKEHERAIQPVESYRAADGTAIAITRDARSSYTATIVGAGTMVCRAKSRGTLHRKVEGHHPGGTWSHQLSQRDRAAVLERWGIR